MPSAWETLQGLPAWRVATIPRPSTAPDPAAGPRDPLAAQRLAALTAAYHTGRAVAFGWIRDSVGGPVQVLAAGPALAAWSDRGAALLTLPAGGQGTAIGGRAAAGLAERLPCWMRIAGTADGLLAGPAAAGDQAGMVRPTLDDGLLATWPGPFGWLLVAEPVPAAELDELLAAAARALGSGQKYDSPKAQLTVRRLEQRHLELGRSRAAGLWHVRLLAGAATREAAAQVAGLVCASADLADLPYALQPLPGCGGAAEALDAAGPARAEDPAEPVPSCPFAGSSALLAALARPPAREVPGLRLVLRPEFDLTPEIAPAAAGRRRGWTGSRLGGGRVALGEVLDWNRVPCGDLAVPLASLNRHVFVCGATGAGKSQTVRNLLEQATAAGHPVAGGRAGQGRVPADGRPAAAAPR